MSFLFDDLIPFCNCLPVSSLALFKDIFCHDVLAKKIPKRKFSTFKESCILTKSIKVKDWLKCSTRWNRVTRKVGKM
jgi:hypothetical protein